MREFYRHKVTGIEFEKLAEADECNDTDIVRRMVIYGAQGGGGKTIFAREKTDFERSFEPLPHVCRWRAPHDCGDPECHAKGVVVCLECGEPKPALNG